MAFMGKIIDVLADFVGEDVGVVEATLNTLHESARLVEIMTGYGPFKEMTYGEVADIIFGSFEPRTACGVKCYPLNGKAVYPIVAAFRAEMWDDDELVHPGIMDIYNFVTHPVC